MEIEAEQQIVYLQAEVYKREIKLLEYRWKELEEMKNKSKHESTVETGNVGDE